MGACVVVCGTVASAQVSLLEMDSLLDNALWNKRILAVCDVDRATDGGSLIQQQYDQADWLGFLERDLLLLSVDRDELYAWAVVTSADNRLTVAISRDAEDRSNLRERTDCTGERAFVALIGKDGDVKRVWEGVVPNKAIFATIDAMPMRRSEMKERGAQ